MGKEQLSLIVHCTLLSYFEFCLQLSFELLMDWVHCNKCLARPSNNITFSLTSCGHLLCGSCTKGKPGDSCLLCSVRCSSVPLCPPIPPQVEMIVTDPVITLKKVSKAFKFQEENHLKLHKNHLLKAKAHLEELDKKYLKLKQENQRLRLLLTHARRGAQHHMFNTPLQGRMISPMISRQITLQTPQSLGFNTQRSANNTFPLQRHY